MWILSHRFDKRALPLADAHYSRRKRGLLAFHLTAEAIKGDVL